METIVQEGPGNVSEVCRHLNVNRTSFYACQAAEPTNFEEQDAQLAPLIRIIFKRHRRRYGARRDVWLIRHLEMKTALKKNGDSAWMVAQRMVGSTSAQARQTGLSGTTLEAGDKSAVGGYRPMLLNSIEVFTPDRDVLRTPDTDGLPSRTALPTLQVVP